MFATHFPTTKPAWYVKFSEVEHLPICIESFMTTAEPIFNKKKQRNATLNNTSRAGSLTGRSKT